MAKKNYRPLTTITAELHRFDRQLVFALGQLVEAKGEIIPS
jgi:hypothetical protein